MYNRWRQETEKDTVTRDRAVQRMRMIFAKIVLRKAAAELGRL